MSRQKVPTPVNMQGCVKGVSLRLLSPKYVRCLIRTWEVMPAICCNNSYIELAGSYESFTPSLERVKTPVLREGFVDMHAYVPYFFC